MENNDDAVLDHMNALAKLNFVKFLSDLVDYCLSIMRLKWERPLYQRHTLVLFRSYIGDAVLRYRNGHDEKFRVGIQERLPLQNIEEFVSEFVEDHFAEHETQNVALLLFEFCAFLVDLAVFCCRCHRPDLVDEALEASCQVHTEYIALYGMNVIWKVFKGVVREKRDQFDARREDSGPSPSTSKFDEERSLDEEEYRKSEKQLLRSMGKLELSRNQLPRTTKETFTKKE